MKDKLIHGLENVGRVVANRKAEIVAAGVGALALVTLVNPFAVKAENPFILWSKIRLSPTTLYMSGPNNIKGYLPDGYRVTEACMDVAWSHQSSATVCPVTKDGTWAGNAVITGDRILATVRTRE